MKVLLVAAALAAPVAVQAQWNVATINGVIGTTPDEYGDHANGFNQLNTVGGQTWYATWDNNNLYVAVTNANVAEAVVLYIDTDPQSIVNSGTDANGTTVGFNYDGASFAELPWRANFVCYAKDTYREFRNSDGAGGWGAQTAGFGAFATGAGNVREISIPWNDITGGAGRPSQFNWFGYVVSGGGFVYAGFPGENGGGAIGLNARYERYFKVDATGDGTSIDPFTKNCFVFNRTANATGIGAIDVFDFTMNDPFLLERAAGFNGAWTIRERMIVNDGTVSFGTTTDLAQVFGNVSVNPAGTLILSSNATGYGEVASPLGDLQCFSQFTNTGTVVTNDSELIFTGTTNSTIVTDDPVANVRTSKLGAATLTALSDVLITDCLYMDSGDILPNGNNVQVTFDGPDGVNQGVEHAGSVANGIVLGRLNRTIGNATGDRFFPVGTVTSELSPVLATQNAAPAATGTLAVTPNDVRHPSIGGSQGISRWWQLDPVGLAGYDFDLDFTYVDEDIAGFAAAPPTLSNLNPADESGLVAARYTGVGSTWDSGNGTSLTVVGATNTGTVTNVTQLSPWTILRNSGLTVDLTSFTASTSGPGAPVTLAWETASEIDSAGFRIHVGSPEGPAVGGLVPAEGSASSGASYSLVDSNGLAAGESRDYYLVEVELDGSTNTYGPATATVGSGSASSVSDWTMY